AFGASSVKISNLSLGFGRTKLGTLQASHGLGTRIHVRYHSLVVSKKSANAFIGCRCSSKAECTTAVTDLEDGPEGAISSGTTNQLIPNSYEVESLLAQICDTTSIAEFELKLDGFRLYVTRDLTVKNKSASLPISAPVSVNATVEAPDINGSVSLLSVPISKPVPPSTGLQRFLDKAADEGLVMLKSPRVGYFRRSRTIKGKRAPPPCGEGQIVKEGKPLCYIEQLGGQVPVVSEVSGEVIKILREDGDPVGYGDALIAILPSFPGIKKLK
ncbi:Biotin carboxyl carrier protein of acetyl-CoA carboxylase, partial [Actinidia chinensis var. chinensis]